ncbi:hypothetical protein J6590_066057 [Homalodisca vitripennis]|nr:hypothetical protein J6590_066057 [Homalodisca vitripennis]
MSPQARMAKRGNCEARILEVAVVQQEQDCMSHEWSYGGKAPSACQSSVYCMELTSGVSIISLPRLVLTKDSVQSSISHIPL